MTRNVITRRIEMIANAQGLFNRATNALATTAAEAADRLDSLGQQLKDELTAPSNDDAASCLISALEELQDYKRLVSDLEMRQVELSKQSRLLLASMEAEMNVYKNRLKDLGEISQNDKGEVSELAITNK